MAKPLIAGNWKMNTDQDEAIELLKSLKDIDVKEGRTALICPPFIHLSTAYTELEESDIEIGGQNLHYMDNGAYTGEVSGSMLRSIGASYVLVGHSERRELFGETDEIVNEKVHAAIKNDLNAVLCCGETDEERESDRHFDVIESQLRKNLKDISSEDMEHVVIAYEPIWAIGTGKTASSEDAEDMCKFIRELIDDLYGETTAKNIQILYGGSVKASTISDLMSKPNVNGALVGGASLNGEEFEQIINYD